MGLTMLTERYAPQIAGVLSCFDCVLVLGTLPKVCFLWVGMGSIDKPRSVDGQRVRGNSLTESSTCKMAVATLFGRPVSAMVSGATTQGTWRCSEELSQASSKKLEPALKRRIFWRCPHSARASLRKSCTPRAVPQLPLRSQPWRRKCAAHSKRAVTPFGPVAVLLFFLQKIDLVGHVRKHMPIHWKSPNHIHSDDYFCGIPESRVW